MTKIVADFNGVSAVIVPVGDKNISRSVAVGNRVPTGGASATDVLEKKGEEIIQNLLKLCEGVAGQVRTKLNEIKPKEFELSFTVGFDTKANLVIAEISGSTNLQITMKW